MIALLERLLPLWTEPVDGRGDPEAAFAGRLVTAIWVVADDLGLLRQLDAARLNGLRGTRQRRGPPHRLSDAVFPPVYGVRHDLRVPDTLARRRPGLVLIQIWHRNLEFLRTAGSSARSAR